MANLIRETHFAERRENSLRASERARVYLTHGIGGPHARRALCALVIEFKMSLDRKIKREKEISSVEMKCNSCRRRLHLALLNGYYAVWNGE